MNPNIIKIGWEKSSLGAGRDRGDKIWEILLVSETAPLGQKLTSSGIIRRWRKDSLIAWFGGKSR